MVLKSVKTLTFFVIIQKPWGETDIHKFESQGKANTFYDHVYNTEHIITGCALIAGRITRQSNFETT